ncbi:MAG: N-6 DNA methylase, partial [Planctomycetaceae bacterium]|nr:N-6 DNA methylase [Planctomycetaceae bacterium]
MTNKTLCELIELFQTNLSQYKSSEYDESNTRTDFIDKFFELLDWDVRNTSGFSEQYRDVVREDRVEIDNRPKAPDYSFRIGGYRKFFVEAKKPSVNIHDEIAPAFQLRSYGYSAKLALSILTDFEEFAVYDTRIKPHKNDKASTARVFYCKFSDYLGKSFVDGYETNFDFICSIFSKESILKGSFDRYVESALSKRGTSEVDQDLLELIEQWRLTLAKNIARLNPELGMFHLNVAVQRIIDRILFLRIAEDRRIERYENLFRAAKGKNVYKNLQKLCENADDKYNAGLFKQEAWLDALNVPDKILTDIVTGLYSPESPYAFSVLPIEILGSIYERFLGKMIRLTPSHNATVEEKPEVRKAGGVYYTPQYIVDYIIKETVGRKITGEENRKRDQMLTILDPACGSGSFLVGAYTFLLDYYLANYCNENNLKKSLKQG